MPVAVIYPKASLEESNGRIARWLVSEGEIVTAGQVIFEIENDKAAIEVESPASGILRDLVAEGATVQVGSEVAHIQLPDEPHDIQTPPRTVHAAPEVAKVAGPPVVSLAARGPNPTPLARRLARDSGLVLAGVAGTGPRGRVQKKDVLARLTELAASPHQGVRPVTPFAHRTDLLNAVWLRKGDGVPVVLLHGYSADLNNWRGLFAGARVDWPVLALDLPAHGGSPRTVPEDMDMLAAQIEATLAQAGVSTAVLCGHSFGGLAAARIAARGHLDVRGLCLFAPAGLGPQINHAFTDGILRARKADSLRPWLELLVKNPAVITETFLRAVVAAREDEGLTRAMSAFARQFFPDGTQAFCILQDLAGLRMPARVIFGRQDAILPFDGTRSLPGNVGLYALDQCGHMPHLEHPALALALLTEAVRAAA